MSKIPFLVLSFLFLSLHSFGQINMSDSSVQVIGYWEMSEKQSYTVTQEKYKVNEADTIDREFFKYEVDITIVDSTANSYTINWFYRDNEVKSENEFTQKLSSISNDMTVQIRTNELGVFEEVVNWEEIKEYVSKSLKVFKKDKGVKKLLKQAPDFEEIIDKVEQMYSTKEAIEAGVIKDIAQFYTFHGAKYELDEKYEGVSTLMNLLGGKPFDTKMEVSLDEINPEQNNYIMRMKVSVDSNQLTEATFAYLNQINETVGGAALKREEFPNLTNDIWTASRIHGSGWVIYSVETKEVLTKGVTAVEERIIEIQ